MKQLKWILIFIPVFLLAVFGIGYYYLLHDGDPELIVDSEVQNFLEQEAKNYIREQYNEEIGIAKIYYDHIYYG